MFSGFLKNLNYTESLQDKFLIHDIYENNKTCKEYANSMSSIKTYESDELCKKYRNRYKNLQKQSSLSSNPKVLLLYEKYKLDGAKILEKYQHGKITAEEFESWIDSMKIRAPKS